MLTVEELMMPRFKVMIDYPDSDYKVGQIVENIGVGYIAFLDSYPNIFKKMDWWEERQSGQMPDYISNGKIVLKVDKHFSSSWDEFTQYGAKCGDSYYSYSRMKPATEAEYLAQLEQQKTTR
jgi:hypothetical protein